MSSYTQEQREVIAASLAACNADDEQSLFQAQLIGLMEGEGASEDHADVKAALATLPLSQQAVTLLHAVLVNALKPAPADVELERLRELAATCYAGLGAECNLPEAWLDVLNAAANGEPFSVEGLLPFTAAPAQPVAPQGVAYAELPDVDALAQEIRRVDGAHKLGAGALAEALMPFLRASHGQAPAAPVTVEQVEDAIGLQSTAWDTIGAEKIVEAVLRLANGQAPAGAAFPPAGCGIHPLSSRACERGTKSCVVQHEPTPTAQAAPAAGAVVGPVDDIDAIALARYKVVPAHESMFHRFAVVAGDGKQQLYLGRETECQNMARKFAGAFLDGAFHQSQIAAAPTPAAQADSVLEDAARWKWLTENCDGDDQDDFTNWLCATVADKASIDAKADEYIRHATRKQGGKHD